MRKQNTKTTVPLYAVPERRTEQCSPRFRPGDRFCELSFRYQSSPTGIRELKQPRRRRQQERHKFAYLTMKNSTFARFARAVFIFGHLADVLDLSTT